MYNNVFGRYFINGHYFSLFRSELIQYDDSDSDSSITTYLSCDVSLKLDFMIM
jgi:hypothetical protein